MDDGEWKSLWLPFSITGFPLREERVRFSNDVLELGCLPK
jgi:hypothetical protein